MTRPKYITRLERVPELTESERRQLGPVSEKFVFRTNEYYQSLIDWDDPGDPIRRIIMPQAAELQDWGRLDASDEARYTVVLGLEHKYSDTALLLVNDVCGGYCRFCFRKRLFMNDNDETVRDVTEGLKYIAAHKEITNVLLTGGDPLILSTRKLEGIIKRVREIDHVHIIRIGTKMPAFNPYRILDDPALPEMIRRYTSVDRKIYIMAHFNHPRELTRVALEGLNVLREAGAILVNQTPMIKGVNDDARVLTDLFRKLSFTGVPPYYVFQCRPTLGNRSYAVPLEAAFEIFERARSRCSGLAKRARFVMSHASGKIEMVGISESRVFFRYHRAADPGRSQRMMVYPRNPRAYWFDHYLKVPVETTRRQAAIYGRIRASRR